MPSAVLPAERAARMQPNRALIDAGALIAGGSDWPVSEPRPLGGHPGPRDPRRPVGELPARFGPSRPSRCQEAIAVFTLNAAKAMGLGEETGSLVAGKSADFVMLDRDRSGRPDALVETTVFETWFAGRQVYLRD